MVGFVVAALVLPPPFLPGQEPPDTGAPRPDSTPSGPPRSLAAPTPTFAPTFAQSLIGRYPGVLVYPSSGTVAAGARIRIRGSSPLSPSEPAVYVDGVRVEADERGLTFGLANEWASAVAGRFTSRLDDFDPEDVDSIAIVRGPAAGAMHGPELAAGAILVYTRQGRHGPPRWHAYGEEGRAFDVTDWPANYGGVDGDHADSAYRIGGCTLQAEAAGFCTQDFVRSFAPLVAHEQFRTAPRRRYGVIVGGGRGPVTYALGGDVASEGDVYELSRAEADRLDSLAGSVPEEVIHPGYARRSSLFGSVGIAVGRRASAGIGVFRRTLDARRPPAEGFLFSGLIGHSDSTLNDGWGLFRPGDLFQAPNVQEVRRLGGSVRLAWRPIPVLAVAALAGFDEVDQRAFPMPQPYARVYHDAAVGRRTYELGGTLTVGLPLRLSGRTQIAVRRLDYRLDAVFFEEFRDPSDTSLFSQRELRYFPRHRTTSVAAEQEVSWRDRVALTAGLRLDDLEVPPDPASWVFYIPLPPFPPSTPPAEPGMTLYPAVGLTVAPVVAPWGILDRLSLRLGYGSAGRRFGLLEPERTNELEFSAGATLLNGRAALEARGYSRTTRDALTPALISTSTGFVPSIAQGARVSNRGLEVTVTAVPVWTGRLAWDVTFGAWGNRNRLTTLPVPPFDWADPPSSVPMAWRMIEGYPIFGYWDRPILGYDDANGDGILSDGEVLIGETPVFLGSSYPTQGATLSTAVTLWDRVRIGGLFEYRAGHVLLNEMAWLRCAAGVCPERQDRATPLDRQVAAAARRWTLAGFVEDADYLKLREVSLTLMAPPSVTRAFRASSLHLTVVGRNLATWTGYSGFDPEVNTMAQDGFVPYRDRFAQPPVRSWSLRLDLAY